MNKREKINLTNMEKEAYEQRIDNLKKEILFWKLRFCSAVKALPRGEE